MHNSSRFNSAGRLRLSLSAECKDTIVVKGTVGLHYISLNLTSSLINLRLNFYDNIALCYANLTTLRYLMVSSNVA